MSNLEDITVLILAGGLGTRLKRVVRDKPKVLAEVNNHPFLEFLLNQINMTGFKKVILCTGYLSDQVEKTFGTSYKSLDLFYSPEKKPLGTAGSLRKALPLVDSDTALVMNGDSFCDVNLKNFWKFHLIKRSRASLVLTRVSDSSPYASVKRSKDNIILGFREKEPKGGKFINAGIYLISKSIILEIPKNKNVSIEKDVFPNWVGKGFYGYKGSNNFIDIGTPENYAEAQQFFAKYEL